MLSAYRVLAAVAGTALLAGCAVPPPVYRDFTGANRDNIAFKLDQGQCLTTANGATIDVHNMIRQEIEASGLFDNCMQGRGWEQVRTQ